MVYKETLCPSSLHRVSHPPPTNPSSLYETLEGLTDLSEEGRLGDSLYAEVKDMLGREEEEGVKPVTEPIYVELESSTCGKHSGCTFSSYLEQQLRDQTHMSR